MQILGQWDVSRPVLVAAVLWGLTPLKNLRQQRNNRRQRAAEKEGYDLPRVELNSPKREGEDTSSAMGW